MPADIVKSNKKFENIHGNYKEPFARKVALYNKNKSHKKFDAADYNATSEDIKKTIQEALDDNLQIRMVGSKWSLSKAPYVNGVQVFAEDKDGKPSLLYKEMIATEHLSKKEDNTFVFAQTGNTVKKLNEFLFQQDRSLMASGASNGQSVAGVISTGVHGSGLKVGSVQDTVVGLHIIAGPGRSDSVYVEAKSNPIVNSKFAKRINAKLIRDDNIFKAALVGLGSFGFIHGVTFKTEPLFLLANFVRKVDISDAYDFLKTMKNTGGPLRIAGMNSKNLYHMKFYINQYDQKDNVRAEIMYKLPVEELEAQKGFFGKLLNYGKDFLIKAVLAYSQADDNILPGLINKLLPKEDKEIGYLKDIFGDTSNLRKGQFSCALAVDIEHAQRVIQYMMDHFKDKKNAKIPSVFSMRFVKKSKATMAFTKYKMNCLIGIDGASDRRTERYLEYISDQLRIMKVPHTWHWGKVNEMDAVFVRDTYGTSLTKWSKARKALIPDIKVRQAFTSEYTRKLGIF